MRSSRFRIFTRKLLTPARNAGSPISRPAFETSPSPSASIRSSLMSFSTGCGYSVEKMRPSLLRNLSCRNASVPAASDSVGVRMYSSESGEKPDPAPEASSAVAKLGKEEKSVEVEDVSNKDLKEMMETYFKADIKEKVEKKFNELGDMCEIGELEPEDAYKLFKEFEDQIVIDYGKRMETEGAAQLDETTVPDKKKGTDDPPGEGPILRWQTRAVFAPGGDAWHPKNRKVKMFEHREENRKDCLRTLFSIIEEAGKANKMAEDARVAYVKGRLKANPAFMERLHAKAATRSSHAVAL
ncbi:unnamed protein product [Linum tenue]|uniref:Uncharacterized protein n=1 Tax=Linum tenue TaxID=586396 RepID=A0AAV0IGV9_9ROSI|nr:unnamed protein product [Linum tenue]